MESIARTLHIKKYYGSLDAMQKRFDKRARQDAFCGSTAREFLTWQQKSRNTLTDLLGLNVMEMCPIQPCIDEKVQLPAFLSASAITREHLILQVEPGIYMTAFLLIPEQVKDPECYIALPGHMGAGKYSVAGCSDIPAVKESIDRFNYDYGLALAKKGYVVACPDCRGFGERRDEDLQDDSESSFLNSTCFQLAHMAEGLGETVCGMCTWDVMRLVDYMIIRGKEEGWNTDTLGCVGFSGGGMQTLWAAAMDERIKKVLISGYMYGYKDSLLTLNGNCNCNYIPHLWEHFDMGDVASLIAPRKLFIQSCRDDHLNGPRGLDNVYEQVDIIKRAYQLFDKQDNVVHDIREGEHCFHQEVLESFCMAGSL
nr:alpha/beta hydrolase family protein [Butyrivibrio sp.]